jgi:Spy/CpxP family protein refolding chaperone
MARYHLLVIALAFFAAVAGVWLGRGLFTPEPAMETRFHDLMHHQLDLDASQKARIEALEKNFAATRAAYENEMRADNGELAHAIAEEKGYGPKVAQAVDKSHIAMGMLQKQTLQHLFAMRSVLHPEQAARFDAAMAKALTTPAR